MRQLPQRLRGVHLFQRQYKADPVRERKAAQALLCVYPGRVPANNPAWVGENRQQLPG